MSVRHRCGLLAFDVWYYRRPVTCEGKEMSGGDSLEVIACLRIHVWPRWKSLAIRGRARELATIPAQRTRTARRFTAARPRRV